MTTNNVCNITETTPNPFIDNMVSAFQNQIGRLSINENTFNFTMDFEEYLLKGCPQILFTNNKMPMFLLPSEEISQRINDKFKSVKFHKVTNLN